MKVFNFNQFCLNEKIARVDLEAFAKNIEQIYQELPSKQDGKITVNVGDKELTGTVEDFWSALNKSNKKLFKQIESRYHVEFVDENPYESAEQMRKEVNDSKILKIYKGESSNHPFFTEEENWMFRAVHDYYTHIIHGENFNLRGELRAYNTHSKLASPMALPALYTEVVGQVCVAIVTGDFPEQKMSVIPGVDYKEVGKIQ